jgi:Restriction endonuclease
MLWMSPQSGPIRRMFRYASWSLVWLFLAALAYWERAALVGVLRSRLDWLSKPMELQQQVLAIAPFALPVVCGAASLWYAVKGMGATGSIAAVRGAEDADWVRRLGWLQFEQLVESHFAHRGMHVALLRGSSKFPARLSLVDSTGAIALIHYSEWKSVEIGYDVVNGFCGEIVARSAQSGVLLTFGRLTRGALSLASAQNIEVVSGAKLTRMLRSSGWDASRFRESASAGASTGFDNSRSSDSTHSR